MPHLDTFFELYRSYQWALVGLYQYVNRRFGRISWLLLLLLVAALFLLVEVSRLSKQVDVQKQQLLVARLQPKSQPSRNDSHQEKIAAIKSIMPAYSRIPSIVQNMLQLAVKHNLSNLKGEYRAQADNKGDFLRYQILMPVSGDIQPIYKYIQQVLIEQKTLALESIKFKRERADAGEIEAQISWVLYTRLPSESDKTPKNSKE